MNTVSPIVPSSPLPAPTFSFATAPKRNDRFYAAITSGQYACVTFVLVDHEAPTFTDLKGNPSHKTTLVTRALTPAEKQDFRRQLNSIISSIQRREDPTAILTRMKALCVFSGAMLADRQEPYRKPGETRSATTSTPTPTTADDFTPDWERDNASTEAAGGIQPTR